MGSVRPGRGVAAELFAGVGGFRLGLERAGWRVGWSNQWEPSTKAQDAAWCYEHRFGAEGHVNADIARVLDRTIDGDTDAVGDESWLGIPDHDLLVGGFPCQDYSVAKPLHQADGIAGKKGVLWWEINRWVEHHEPRLVLLENVDRLLKSPASQRGRDFAVMLSCFARLGYSVEWRVINAEDYGYPQRRRRVFILARRDAGLASLDQSTAAKAALVTGVTARALPLDPDTASPFVEEHVGDDPYVASERFGVGDPVSRWGPVGVMADGVAWTGRADAVEPESRTVLGDVLVPDEEVPESFVVPISQLAQWKYLKGAKREPRTSRSGHRYLYTEGGMSFPDPVERSARTILTSEGGSGPSRSKHVVEMADGRLRRLVPVELERLNGFPDGHTAELRRPDGTVVPMSPNKRAFMMGNALVVGIVERIANELPLD